MTLMPTTYDEFVNVEYDVGYILPKVDLIQSLGTRTNVGIDSCNGTR